MKRRTFLAFLGLVPASPVLAKIPAPKLLRIPPRWYYMPSGEYLGYLAEGARTTTWMRSPTFTRETAAWTKASDGTPVDVRQFAAKSPQESK